MTLRRNKATRPARLPPPAWPGGPTAWFASISYSASGRWAMIASSIAHATGADRVYLDTMLHISQGGPLGQSHDTVLACGVADTHWHPDQPQPMTCSRLRRCFGGPCAGLHT